MKYYTVIGRTAAELRAQINRLGPKDQYGQPYDGQADSELRWSYQVATVENRCVVTAVNVHVQTTITMPQWTPPPDAPSELRERWVRYYSALLFHENGHKELGNTAGKQLVQLAAALPPAATCDDLKASLDDLAQDALAWLTQQNIQYDLTTQHGRTQGARFP
jgi:predicted secreted Zn-dependent protease